MQLHHPNRTKLALPGIAYKYLSNKLGASMHGYASSSNTMTNGKLWLLAYLTTLI